ESYCGYNAVKLCVPLSDIGRVSALLQLLVDRFYIVVAFGIGEGTRLHEQRLESREHLAGHDLETAFRLVGGVDGIDRVTQGTDAIKAPGSMQPCRIKTQNAGGSRPPRLPQTAALP